jgi:hypothetical protein
MAQEADSKSTAPASADGADEPSLPELMKQAAALTASTDAQMALFSAMARAKSMPTAPPPPSADGLSPDDLPRLLKQMQEETTQAVSALGAMTASLGFKLPAGAGMDDMMAVLGAAAQAKTGAVVPTLPTGQDPATLLPTLMKQLAEEQVAAQKAQDAMFTKMGIDPAAPEKAVPPVTPTPPPVAQPLSGFPGAEKVASLPVDLQRLTDINLKMLKLLIPK